MRLIKGYRYFESQERAEEVILIVRLYWLILITPFIFGTLSTAVVAGFTYIALKNGVSIVALPYSELIFRAVFSLSLLYGTLYIFSSWLTRYLNVIILTNKHIVDIKQAAFFSRKISTLALDSIEDVAIQKKGILSNLLDYGDLLIQTAGELPNFSIKRIGDPEGVQRAIMEAKEHYSTHPDHHVPIQPVSK